jgi:hypothetical protein
VSRSSKHRDVVSEKPDTLGVEVTLQ